MVNDETREVIRKMMDRLQDAEGTLSSAQARANGPLCDFVASELRAARMEVVDFLVNVDAERSAALRARIARRAATVQGVR